MTKRVSSIPPATARANWLTDMLAESAARHAVDRPCKNKSANTEAERLALSLRRGLFSGSVASIASVLTLMATGRVEGKPAAAGINAISHWLWDRPAFAQRRWRLPFSLPGFVIHHSMSVFWATLFERMAIVRGSDRPQRRAPIAHAAAIGALAYTIDFHFTPRRLTPGFEHVVSKRSLVAIYIAFAAGLALAHSCDRRGRND